MIQRSHIEKDELIHQMAELLKSISDLPVFGSSTYSELYNHIQDVIRKAKGVNNV